MTNNKSPRTPDVVIARLALYLRALEQFQFAQHDVIASQELAEHLMISAVQIRKDLSYFGDFGKQGQGYPVQELVDTLRKLLNANRVWPVVLVGVGQLGRALIGSKHLADQGFQIDAIFDNDRNKVGQAINEQRIIHVNHLQRSVESLDCRIGIICTPSSSAQRVADRMVNAGIRCILNYAPATLHVSSSVYVQNIDPVVCLRQMTFHLGPKSASLFDLPMPQTQTQAKGTHSEASSTATFQPPQTSRVTTTGRHLIISQ